MNGSRELTIPNRVRSASAMTGKCQKNRSQVKFISTYREAQKYAAGMTSRAISAGRLLTFRNAHIKCVDCGNKAYHYEHRSYNHPEIVEPVCRKCNRKAILFLICPINFQSRVRQGSPHENTSTEDRLLFQAIQHLSFTSSGSLDSGSENGAD